MRKPPAPAPGHAPAYTKYQEWVDAGRPYWPGVALFNQLNVLPALRGLFNKRESTYNREKLASELKKRLSQITGTPPEKTATGPAVSKPATPDSRTPDSSDSRTPDSVDSKASRLPPELSQLGPEFPRAYTDAKLKAIPFATLPAVLQQGRIAAIAKYRQRSQLHDQLAGEWELVRDAEGRPMGRRWLREPLQGDEAERVAQTIVELSDAIATHFDAEVNWATTGALPVTPKSLLEELAELTDLQLERRLKNQVNHRIKRWKKATGERDGDELVQAQMELTLAEQERDAIKAMQAERAAKAEAELQAYRERTYANARKQREHKANYARKARAEGREPGRKKKGA